MALSKAQSRYLKKLAHALKPVLLIGQHGVSESLLAELVRVLETHELIKVKVLLGDKEDRAAAIDKLVEFAGAELVGVVGRIAILYKPTPENKVLLPSK